MKQFYPRFPAFWFAKVLLLSAIFLCAGYAPEAQVYYASLSGPNEATPNNSPGTGKSVVTIDGNFMRVQVTFSGLLGSTTASHIHAATPIPLSLTSTAGVATQVPTFIGFPLGVQAGTYDQTFDMTLASSYNAGYVAANGGTPASAFDALKAAIAAGRSYLNIHSTQFPPGEIRGYLVPCPTITVTIPDAFVLAQGVLPNTVYPAYAPAASLGLQANVSGGTGPYLYNWNNGATGAAITVSPAVNTTYSVTVHDQNGCAGSASKMVKVMDVSSGKKGDKIDVCHQGRSTLSVAAPAVAAHLGHGDMLGKCSDGGPSAITYKTAAEQPAGAFSVRVFSNPAPNFFELQISGNADNRVQLRVFDLLGRAVETRSSLPSNQTLRLGAFYRPGIYLVQIAQGKEMKTLRLIKMK